MTEGQALAQLLARTDLALIAIAHLLRASRNENLLLAISASAQQHRAQAMESGAPPECLQEFDEALGDLLRAAQPLPPP